MSEQPQKEDMLLDRDVDDLLDEGFSPPEREPATLEGVTPREAREGESLDERLREEEPDVDEEYEVDLSRSGRLVAPDEGIGPDDEKDMVARDVGLDGAAASAEEAAVHLVDEDGNPVDAAGRPLSEM